MKRALAIGLVLSLMTGCSERGGPPSIVSTQTELVSFAPPLGSLTLDLPHDNLFGPEVFVRTTGIPIATSRQVAGGAFDDFVGPFVLHLRNGNADGSARVSSAAIWLDEDQLFGPSHFSQQVTGYDREVQLRAGSTLKVLLASKLSSSLTIWIEGRRIARRQLIPPQGGTLSLGDVASAMFPVGTFSSATTVRLSLVIASGPETFDSTGPAFKRDFRAQYDVKLEYPGAAQPDSSVTVSLPVPASFVSGGGPGDRINGYARVLSGGMEEYYHYVRLASFPALVGDHIRFELPFWTFTNKFNAAGAFTTLATVGASGVTPSHSAMRSLATPLLLDVVPMATRPLIGAPVDCPTNFDGGQYRAPRTKSDTGRLHDGVDMSPCAEGTPVVAANDGELEIDNNDPNGYGTRAAVYSNDGCWTMYAHLAPTEPTSTPVPVSRGTVIGRVDHTGHVIGSPGNHLHFEYHCSTDGAPGDDLDPLLYIDSDGDGVPGDGVPDGSDKCPNTPHGATVDAVGCPSDSDGDGVFNGIDLCPDTPLGTPVDEFGCPLAVDRVVVSPDPLRLVVGATGSLRATALDVLGNAIPNLDFVWARADGFIRLLPIPGVTDQIVVKADGAGLAHVIATVEGVSGFASVDVVPFAGVWTGSRTDRFEFRDGTVDEETVALVCTFEGTASDFFARCNKPGSPLLESTIEGGGSSFILEPASIPNGVCGGQLSLSMVSMSGTGQCSAGSRGDIRASTSFTLTGGG